MEEKSTATLEKIQQAAMEEFSGQRLPGGLPAADREAGRGDHRRTSMAISPARRRLFASIVEPHAAALMGRFMEAQTSFAELPEGAAAVAHGDGVQPAASTGWWTTSATTGSQ